MTSSCTLMFGIRLIDDYGSQMRSSCLFIWTVQNCYWLMNDIISTTSSCQNFTLQNSIGKLFLILHKFSWASMGKLIFDCSNKTWIIWKDKNLKSMFVEIFSLKIFQKWIWSLVNDFRAYIQKETHNFVKTNFKDWSTLIFSLTTPQNI